MLNTNGSGGVNGSGRKVARKHVDAIALPVLHVEVSELLAALAAQETRVQAEVDGSLRARMTRVRSVTAEERAYWRSVAEGRRK